MIQTNPETQNALPEGDSEAPNSMRTKLAAALHRAAEALNDKVSQAPDGRSEGLGLHAVNWLDQSAEYIKQADIQQMKADVSNQIRRNPGRSLLIAGAVGLLVGALVRRR